MPSNLRTMDSHQALDYASARSGIVESAVMNPPSVELPLSDIEEARAVLRRHLPQSPCLEVHDGATRAGRLLVKAENLMPTGSFKIRGATWRLQRLS